MFIEALLSLGIFLAFEKISRQKNFSAMRIISILLCAVTFPPLLLVLFAYFQKTFFLGESTIALIIGCANLLFGIALTRLRTIWGTIAPALGILYLLEGLVLISTFWIPVRLAEFTIAICILEAVFFWNLAKR